MHLSSQRAIGRAVAGTVLMGLVTIAAPATAITRDADSVRGPISAGSGAALAVTDPADPGTLLLVLDASGSMKEPDPTGGTKMAAAKTALTNVVKALPDDAQVGLRVYGATVDGGKPTPKACADTQLAQPIGRVDRTALIKKINSFAGRGETPISYALEQALKDVGTSGKRNIILVSDGEESCVPDPCPVVKKLISSGVDLHIDTVGFAVNSSARNQLSCLAEAGNGTYYDAANAVELANALTVTSRQAIRPFTVQGTPVVGTKQAAGAPTLTAGQYTDVVTASTGGKTSRWYRVQRRLVGSTLHVNVTARMPYQTSAMTALKTGGWEYELMLPDGETPCDSTWNTATESVGLGQFVTGTVAAHPLDPVVDEAATKASATCGDASELLMRVGRTKGTGGSVPVELLVIEEPGASNADALPAGDAALPTGHESDAAASPASGTPAQVTGGVGFVDAALLKPGTYMTNIVPGEQAFFRTTVDWGQKATFAVDGVDRSVLAPYAKDVIYPYVSISGHVYGPDRGQMDSQTTQSWKIVQIGTAEKPAPWINLTPTVAYRSRWDSPKAYFGHSHSFDMAGDYYFAVGAGQASVGSNANGIPIPTYFSIGVEGEVTGSPQYTTPFDMSAMQAKGVLSTAAHEGSGSARPGTDATDKGSSSSATPTTSWVGSHSALLYGTGAGGLALAAVGVLILGRRSRRNTSPEPPAGQR